MKAIVCTKYRPPDVLQLKEVAKPTPKEDEVLIKVHATTVTRGDVRLRSAPYGTARPFGKRDACSERRNALEEGI